MGAGEVGGEATAGPGGCCPAGPGFSNLGGIRSPDALFLCTVKPTLVTRHFWKGP